MSRGTLAMSGGVSTGASVSPACARVRERRSRIWPTACSACCKRAALGAGNAAQRT